MGDTVRLLSNSTPRQLLRWSLTAFYVAAPLTGLHLAVVAWAPSVHAERPHLMMMAYLLSLAAVVGSLVIAALASCHMAVSRAFAAGVRAGQDMAVTGTEPPPTLRAVQ